jgi:hypothetical protein
VRKSVGFGVAIGLATGFVLAQPSGAVEILVAGGIVGALSGFGLWMLFNHSRAST